MLTPTRLALTLSALLVALALPAWAESPKQEKPKLEKPVLDLLALAKLSEQSKDLRKPAAQLYKKHDLVDLKQAFKLRTKGGIGVGKTKSGEGIEKKILALDRRPLTAEQLKEEAADLVKMAHVLIAMAEVTKLRPPPYYLRKWRWLDCCSEMEAAAKDLIKAIKAGDSKAAKKAVRRSSNSCAECHSFLGWKVE